MSTTQSIILGICAGVGIVSFFFIIAAALGLFDK